MDERDLPDPPKSIPAVHCEVVQSLETNGTINVFVICLDRVGYEQNIIDRGFSLQLACAVSHARQRAAAGEIDLVVMCSAKKGSFLAGADLYSELKFIGKKGSESAFNDSTKLCHVICALEALSVPTVAILNGSTLGGGLELALACDYRVVDTSCTQIGLPEVKMGVLPGVGGCVRLPRLIGLSPALGLLLTGNPIKASKALSIGLVDMLMSNTETVARDLGDQNYSYDYKWLTDILTCVDRQLIGKKDFSVTCSRKDLVAMDTINVSKEITSSTEDELLTAAAQHWREFEAKATKKYPTKRGPFLQSISYIKSMFYYISALVQLWRKIGSRMPAPYICLLTTFRCLCAGSWKEAMVLNSLGFSLLTTTAESKSFMGLFLLTRKLKRLALHFGLKQKEKPQVTNKSILVLVSDQALQFSSAFVQSLLYAGFEVRVVDVSEKLTKTRVEELVRQHFDYSIKRHNMSEEDVESKLSLLLFNHCSDIDSLVLDCDGPLLVADCSVSDEGAEEVIRSLKEQVEQVVCMCVVPNQSRDSDVVMVNLGDPLRKNTLCIEMTPATNKVPPYHIRHIAALIVASGKMPVLTPPTPLTQVSIYLTLTHWGLAVSLATAKYSRGRPNEKKLDSIFMEAGYSKGPFATIRELDPSYIEQWVNGPHFSNLPHFDLLKSYLETRKLPTQQELKGSVCPALSKSDLIEFVTITLGLSALYIRKLTPDISESAIDVLAVSGLTHFPPTEGGPLNYMARLGQGETKRRFVSSMASLPTETVGSVVESFSGVLDSGEIDRLFEKSTTSSDYQRMRQKSLLLTNSEFLEVGQTGVVSRREVFVYPVKFLMATLCVVLALLAVFVFLYWIL